ncbi:hypothetical protein SMU40_08676, partial [Streptococcus mutans 15VF2]
TCNLNSDEYLVNLLPSFQTSIYLFNLLLNCYNEE